MKTNKHEQERWGHSSSVAEDCMFIFGGYTNNFVNDLWCFSFETQRLVHVCLFIHVFVNYSCLFIYLCFC